MAVARLSPPSPLSLHPKANPNPRSSCAHQRRLLRHELPSLIEDQPSPAADPLSRAAQPPSAGECDEEGYLPRAPSAALAEATAAAVVAASNPPVSRPPPTWVSPPPTRIRPAPSRVGPLPARVALHRCGPSRPFVGGPSTVVDPAAPSRACPPPAWIRSPPSWAYLLRQSCLRGTREAAATSSPPRISSTPGVGATLAGPGVGLLRVRAAAPTSVGFRRLQGRILHWGLQGRILVVSWSSGTCSGSSSPSTWFTRCHSIDFALIMGSVLTLLGRCLGYQIHSVSPDEDLDCSFVDSRTMTALAWRSPWRHRLACPSHFAPFGSGLVEN